MKDLVKSQLPTPNSQVAGVLFGIWVLGFGIFVDAQGRGGRGGGGRGGGPEFPTEKQWAESAAAQRSVAAAMKLAGSDLIPQDRKSVV